MTTQVSIKAVGITCSSKRIIAGTLEGQTFVNAVQLEEGQEHQFYVSGNVAVVIKEATEADCTLYPSPLAPNEPNNKPKSEEESKGEPSTEQPKSNPSGMSDEAKAALKKLKEKHDKE